MNKKNIINSILENAKTIIGALIIAIIIRSFIFQPFYIPSSSMEPTLLNLLSFEQSLLSPKKKK